MPMANDPDRDLFPTKECKNPSISSELHVSESHIYDRRSVPHLSRTDLEDQFYRFKEENIELKKATKKQEENLKKLATKMSRLLREKKSVESMNSPSHKRDLELEEMVEDLQDKVHQLEKTNSHLREKMLVAKQQVIMQVKRPYSHIPSKVNSGNISRSPYISSINMRGRSIQNLSKKTGITPISPYALSLLEEAKNELSDFKMLITSQKSEIEQYEQENEILKQKLRMQEIEFEDELSMMKSQLTQRQRQHVQENLDLIRLHRELKQKNTNYHVLQTQFSDMEEKMRMLKLNHDHLVKEMEDLSLRFKAEQKKNLDLLGELQKTQLSLSTVTELQERLTILQKENDFLRETNDKFVKSALAIEKERVTAIDDGKRQQIEEMLREKIVNLESNLETLKKEKSVAIEELKIEQDGSVAKEAALTQLKGKFDLLQTQLTELETKVKVLKSHNLEFSDLEEAVSLLKLKRENKFDSSNEPPTVIPAEAPKEDVQDAFPEISPKELETLKYALKKAEEDHAETLKELANVQNLLKTQCDISEAAQSEIKVLCQKMEQQEKEFETKIQEYSHLLDLRSARTQKLEKQLNDIAYGTQTYESSFPDLDGVHLQNVELKKGENVFEFHVEKANLNVEALKQCNSSNSKIFFTWNFYEYELLSTPIASAKNPVFNFTAQYKVQVDDYFLLYLHEKILTLELHESLGVSFKTFGTSQLNFSDLLSKSCNRIHGTQEIIGIQNENPVKLGTLEFWVQLQIPMQEAFKYFKEKLKALKYSHSNKETSTAAVHLLQHPRTKEEFVNELQIKIIRGYNLKARQKDVQPSSFCIYKFFNLPDHDTSIIPASNNPEFSDHHSFSIFVNNDLEKYLCMENLNIYVFDDNEVELTSYIGKASIPLHPLLQNKHVKGMFELTKNGTSGFGAIEVLVYWQYEYTPLSCDMSSYKLPPPEDIKIPPISETSSSEEDTIAKAPIDGKDIVHPPVPKPRKSISSSIPVTSTPIMKKSGSSSEQGEESSSPSISSVHSSQSNFSLHPDSKQLLKSPSKKGFDVSAEVHSTMDGQTLPNKPPVPTIRRKLLPPDSSDDEQSAFSDESEVSDIKNEKNVLNKLESTMVICIHYLMLRSDAAVLEDMTVKMLYVDYRFLQYPFEELETPFSLPKAPSPNRLNFNFEKVFVLKPMDTEKWRLLSVMLFSDAPESSLIKFTVVSDPSDEQELDCEEIGIGTVDLREILLNQKDKMQEDIIIYDVDDNDTEIGKLNISIQALDALTKLKHAIGS